MQLRTSILFVLFTAILLVGCNQQANQPIDEKFKQVKHTDTDPVQNSVTNEQIATHLANLADDVPGVNQAMSVVFGPYALIGIDVEDHLDSSRVGTIKYSVTEALRNDPYGKTAVVVADPDITARIQFMREKINQGYPTQAIIEELSSIIGRTMPIIPKNDRPVDPNQEDEQLDKKEEDDLEDIQRKQSTENN